MGKPTLFISHSTNKPRSSTRTRTVRELLQDLLASQWNVFVDSERIAPGDPWRASVLYHLAVASAAVILFDSEAARSDWVQAETLMLSFRRSMDPAFPLIPVLFDGLRPEDTCFKRYQPFQLNEIQALADDGEQVLEGLAQRIARSITGCGTAAPNRWVVRVFGLLREASRDALSAAADVLQCKDDLLGLLPKSEGRDSLCRAVVQSMHWQPVLKAAGAIQSLIGELTIEQARRINDCLTAKWVENEAMEMLFCAARDPAGHGVLTIAAKRQQIVDHYFRRARIEMDPDVVTMFSVGAPAGDTEEAVLAGIRATIEQELVPDDYFDEATAEALPLENAVDQKLAAFNAVAFCALPEACVQGNVLAKLRRDFPRIIFLVRAVNRLREPLLLGAEALGPPLEAKKLNELGQLTLRLRNLLKSIGG